MNKIFVTLSLLLLTLGCASMSGKDEGVSLSKDVYERVPFVKHVGKGKFKNYLAMNVKFEPVKDLYRQLDENLGGKLNKKKARTEAHITVITPPEYDFVLSKAVSIDEINALAEEMNIQDMGFKVICLGKGERADRSQQTYYLVVESPELFKLRKRIFDLYVADGGNPSQFDPHLFYPHITVGYTHKDLHLGPHGVKKGLNSCHKWVKIKG